MENLDGYKWVRCSDELIAELSKDWSPTVQLRIAKLEGDKLELEVRHANLELLQESHADTNAEES